MSSEIFAFIINKLKSHSASKTIVAFAKKLGIKTVAEFVHSSPVMGKVKELKIDYSQGYFIDQPTIGL